VVLRDHRSSACCERQRLPVDGVRVRFGARDGPVTGTRAQPKGGWTVPEDEPEKKSGDDADGASAPDEGARGRMRFQDETTTPREPTLAERRAREVAQRRAEEAERQEAEQRERSARKRKRILVGAGVTVGVVALIAVGYSVAQPDDDVQAQCVDEEGVIVDDSNCATPASGSSAHGNYGGGGFYPIFIGGGGRQYHYTYGGAGNIGQRVQGGTTTVPPDGTRVTTSSGKTVAGPSSSGSVSRGGLGVSGGGSSSGS
jgi:hypothetical protein